MKEAILLQTAREYYVSATEAHDRGRANSAVILYFKALVALADIYILRHTGNAPSSHTNRFATCKQQFPQVYRALDKDFPFYQDSYVQVLSLELADIIKEDVHVLAKELAITIR